MADVVCRGPGFQEVVHGDLADDDEPVWLERAGDRLELLWPDGFMARFTPSVEVVDAGGKVLLREGDDLSNLTRFGYTASCPSNGAIGIFRERGR